MLFTTNLRTSQDTIYAPASSTAKAGIAIVRISGPSSKYAMEVLGSKVGQARFAKITKIFHPKTKNLIDECITIFYPSPTSFTGEDVIELNIHGGRAVLNLTLDSLSQVPGLRLAEPGEFSKRRFMNGKMDLTQAEALIDLINAETEAQHRQAIKQLSGSLGSLYENWRTQLLHIIGLIEAYIDFPDEDLPKDIIVNVEKQVTSLHNKILNHLTDNHRGEKLCNGFYITIIGEPNVGKSSLMNNIAKRDVAIVSSIAGTTRDAVEIHLDIAGYPVTIADTAGIRECSDFLENESIRRTIAKVREADLKILVLEANSLHNISIVIQEFIDENTIIVFNKIDLINNPERLNLIRINNKTPILISAQEQIGITDLLDKLSTHVSNFFSITDAPLITRQRHRENLEHCKSHLVIFDLKKNIELAAEDLRLASSYLSRITGKIDIDSILEEIFSNFCIGK